LLPFCPKPPVFLSTVKKTKNTIILPVVLYRYEILLRKEHRLRLFQNRVLRRILELKRDEVYRRLRKTA
jgi:hypothetical protein